MASNNLSLLSTEPNLDSNDKDERIEARRLRIQKKKEEQRRKAQLADVTNSAESLMVVKDDMAQSRRQMEESYIRLKRLHEEGFEMSTNIRVAGDFREVNRRIDNDEANSQRRDKITMEAKIAEEKFEEITLKWDIALQKKLAHELFQMLKEQKSACDAMLEEKNKLINECQAVLKEKDEEYVNELKRQSEDIDLLIERMEHQVKEMTYSYQQELQLIESAFIEERNEMLNEMNKRWNSMLMERRQKELDYMKRREEKVEEYESQLNQLRVADSEEYNRLKIELENIIQMGQMELQHHKVLYQNNHERLEYNFQVIRKRDEESTITKSLQKRKITKLHDLILKYRNKLEKEEASCSDAKKTLIKDFQLINDQYKHLVTKSRSNVAAENDKYRQIWLLNEEECQTLANKLINIDKCLFEQQLGLKWTSPNTDFMIKRDNIFDRHTRNKLTVERGVAKSESDKTVTESEIGKKKKVPTATLR